MLTDFFYLLGILYFWQKLAPKGFEILMRELRGVKNRLHEPRAAEVRASIYRLLLGGEIPATVVARAMAAVDKAANDIERLNEIYVALSAKHMPSVEKTG